MLELGAAMPLIIKSMPPEAIKSLPPVDIHNWPNDAVAWWTLKAAIAAFVIGLLTLAAVVRQIWLAVQALNLANQELDVANKTLKLATDELELTSRTLTATNESNSLVSESLLYTRRQSERLFRSADLRLYSNATIEGSPPPNRGGMVQPTILKLFVANNGRRSARGAMVQLLLPPGLVLHLTPAMRAQWAELQGWNDGYRLFALFERRLEQTFFPGAVQGGFEAEFQHLGTIDAILWRLLYDDGITPRDGTFAKLATTQTLDRTNIIAGMPPPVEGS
jgi:hypothetical protein